MSEAGKEQPGDWLSFGWDPIRGIAWRSRDVFGDDFFYDKIEYSKTIKHPKDPQPHKFMLAVFGEDAYELSDMTVEDWNLRHKAMVHIPQLKCAPSALWQTEHKSSGFRVLIRRRAKGRQPVLGLFHGTSQLCQVPEKAFDDIAAAVAFLKVIGMRFAEELLPKDMIHKFRHEMAQAQGIFLQNRNLNRSSGAAVTGSSEAASCSAAAAVSGLSEAASGAAIAAVTGSSETASGPSKRKQIVSGSTTRKCARTNNTVKAADSPKFGEWFKGLPQDRDIARRSSLEGTHEGDPVDVVDDEDLETCFGIFAKACQWV
jgi:hypothetical protein